MWPPLAPLSYYSSGSPRSHYERRELERLFEVQRCAAQKLLEALLTIRVGTSHLVEREALLGLLDAVQEAGNPAAVLTAARLRRGGPARRTLRELTPNDRPHTTWETLPASLTLAAGEVRVTFTRVEELAAALAALASLLDRELETFAERFEPRQEAGPDDEGHQDVDGLFAELKQMEGKPQGI